MVNQFHMKKKDKNFLPAVSSLKVVSARWVQSPDRFAQVPEVKIYRQQMKKSTLMSSLHTYTQLGPERTQNGLREGDRGIDMCAGKEVVGTVSNKSRLARGAVTPPCRSQGCRGEAYIFRQGRGSTSFHPDSSFPFNAYSDPAPHQSDATLRPLYYRPSRAPIWASTPPLSRPRPHFSLKCSGNST